MPFMLRDLQDGISYQRLRDISFTDTAFLKLFSYIIKHFRVLGLDYGLL